MNYRPFIDGLRAIAVLAVLFYHAELGFPGGYVGVDIFFVISGYLITGIILKDLAQERFHMVAFWERRIRRILPILTVVVGVCLLLGSALLFPRDFKMLGISTVAQALISSNIYFCQAGDYFASATDIKPLLHTWSLAVEEQFYLFFPLLLWVARRWSRPKLVGWLIAASVLSFGLSIYGVHSYPTLTFYLLPTRAWELGLGAILAALAGQRNVLPRWWAQVGSGLGLLGILIAVFGYSTQTPFPGLAALLPCVGTGLIIWTNEKQATWVGRVLAWRGLVGIGLISYSLYLWHWPILVFTRYWIDPESLALRVGLLIGSILLAILTWKYVETPFRQRRWCAARKSIFTFAGVTLLVMIGAGLLIRNTRDMLPWGLPEAAQRYAREKMMDMQRLGKYQRKLPDIVRDNYYELGAGDRAQPAHLLVWGDSHAQSVMPVLEELCRDHALRGVAATHSNMPPAYGFENPDLRGKTSDYYNAVVAYVRQHKVPNVLLVAKWMRYDDGTTRLQQGVARTVADLQATGTKVWIMKIVPQHKNDIPRALAAGALMGPQPEALAWPVPDYLATRPREDTYFSGLTDTGIKLLDPADYLLDEQKQGRVLWGGQTLYYDMGHIALAGAQRLRPLLEPIFRAHTSNTQPKSD